MGYIIAVKKPTDPITFDPFTSNGTSKYEVFLCDSSRSPNEHQPVTFGGHKKQLTFGWKDHVFTQDYCFSKGLLSTNPGKCHFMVFDFQGIYI